MKIKAPKPKASKVKASSPPAPTVAMGDDGIISFRFAELVKTSYVKSKSVDFFINYLDRLSKLSTLSWKEIATQPRHGLGYEFMPISAIKPNVPVTPDSNKLMVFRATGDNHVFIGYRVGSVFNVLFIEAQFGDIYDHG